MQSLGEKLQLWSVLCGKKVDSLPFGNASRTGYIRTRVLSQMLVTDELANDGEKLFCSGIFGRISVLWCKMGPAARSATCCQYLENW
ncbi:hypothetical protein QUB26_09040 [Microcoleus sp. B4-C1]